MIALAIDVAGTLAILAAVVATYILAAVVADWADR